MYPELPLFLVPVAYLVPAVIAFSVGMVLRGRSADTVRGVNYLRMLYYLCLAEGVHNTYYFLATTVRNFDETAYEAFMMPLPWLGAQGVITLTFLAFGLAFLRERTVELGDVRAARQAAEKFRDLAESDPLTGLNNRRSLEDVLEKERSRSRRSRRALTVAMMDLDGFKRFNDTEGHRRGDGMLRDVAEIIRNGMRFGTDIPFRYGGDEFFVILPETGLQGAAVIAERVRREVRSLSGGRITLSVGLEEVEPGSGRSVEEVLRLADEAMYSSKRSGGDRVTLLPPERP